MGASTTSEIVAGIPGGTYDNVPIQTKQQGPISTVAYSVYLDHVDEQTGTLLFGGLDHAKYKGNLGVVPVLPSLVSVGVARREPTYLSVMLHRIGVEDASVNSQSLIRGAPPFVLDTGATYSIVPGKFMDATANVTDSIYLASEGACSIPCGTAGSLELDFSGIKVSVLIDAMSLPWITSGLAWAEANGNAVCDVAFRFSSAAINLAEPYALGDSILRRLYVVHDLGNWEIGIATADLESDSEDIEEITETIPGGTSAASYFSTTLASTFSSASRVSVYLTDFDSGISSGSQYR